MGTGDRYVSDGWVQTEKINRDDAKMPVDATGLRIEDFGLPLNLMLAIPIRIVTGDLRAAIAELSTLRR